MADINLPLIVGAALIDGINPCAFGVLIFLLAYLVKTTKDKTKMLVNGTIYIFAVFLTYLVAGVLLLGVLRALGKASAIAYIVIAILVILAGLIEIKDFFWYGKGISLSIFPSEAARIKKYAKHIGCAWYTAFLLGVFVALVELPCTGAVYLAVLTLMAQAGVNTANMAFLIIYNIIFVLPLWLILWCVYKGIHWKHFEEFRSKHKGLMRLAAGLLLIGLGVWMILATV
jgi:cytochrome c biogenesis protein CcdA